MSIPHGRAHVAALTETLEAVEGEVARLERWGAHLAGVLVAGSRLLAVGNGGSAAQAQHLSAELVGRFRDERPPFSALALNAETSSLTAIVNDYGPEEMFARQVLAHGRPGDVLMALSTSGRSPNVLAAAEAARRARLTVWAFTGPAPNPLWERSHDAVAIDAPATATVQEAHLVLLHLLCGEVERHLPSLRPSPREVVRP